jgi:ABC-type sugar transport system ATPase subunit
VVNDHSQREPPEELKSQIERGGGRAGIARAVAAEAPVLILDEPTASLSAPEAERLFAVVDRLRGRGVGVLYISHRLGDIRRIADRRRLA